MRELLIIATRADEILRPVARFIQWMAIGGAVALMLVLVSAVRI